jgi:hypothetical protein
VPYSNPPPIVKAAVAPANTKATLEQASRLTQAGTVDGVADTACICEARLFATPFDVADERILARLVEPVGALLEHEVGDRHKLLELVIGKVDVVCHA